MFGLIVGAMSWAVECFFVVSVVGALKFLSAKPPRSVAVRDLSPMERYREVYKRVFDLIDNFGGVVDRSQTPTGHGFAARRRNQIRAVRASVVTTSVVAAMTAATAVQNIYHTAVDDIANLPRGRLLPLITPDIRPLTSYDPVDSRGEGRRTSYCSDLVAARSVFEATINATRVLLLFESLCLVNAFVTGKRFVTHNPSNVSQNVASALRNLEEAAPDNDPVEGDLVHNVVDEMKRPTYGSVAPQVAEIANKYYSALKKAQKGSRTTMISGDSSPEKTKSIFGLDFFQNDTYSVPKNVACVPPSHRRRTAVLRKLGVYKDSEGDVCAVLKAGSALESTQWEEGLLSHPSVADALRRRKSTARRTEKKGVPYGDFYKILDTTNDNSCTLPYDGLGIKDCLNASVEGISADGDIDASKAGEGKARFNYDLPTSVLVCTSGDDSDNYRRLSMLEEGLLCSHDEEQKQLPAQEEVGSASGNTCIVNGKQAVVVKPFSVASNRRNDGEGEQCLRAVVKKTILKYANAAFVSCYTMAIMHISLCVSLFERYNNPTAKSRFSGLLYGDELDAINRMPAMDLLSPVVHACRASLSTSTRDRYNDAGRNH